MQRRADGELGRKRAREERHGAGGVEAAGAAEDSRRDKARPRANRKKKKKKKEKPARGGPTLQPLPPHLAQLVNAYTCLDAALMFLDTRGAALKVDVVCAVVTSLRRTQFGVEDLARLWRFAGGIFKIDWLAQASADADGPVLSVTLDDDKARWRGKRGQAKRVAVVRERIEKYAQTYENSGTTHSTSQTPVGVPLPPPRPLPRHPSERNSSDSEQPLCPVPVEMVRARSVKGMLEHLKSLPWYEDQVSHVESYPARVAKFEELGPEISLHPSLDYALSTRTHSSGSGQERTFKFYAHQAQGIRAVLQGHNVAVSTGTGSGKSLIAYVPVIDTVLKDPQGTSSLFLFPTKALSQDQIGSLKSLIANIPLCSQPTTSATDYGYGIDDWEVEPSSSSSLPTPRQGLPSQDRISVCTLDGDTPPRDREIAKDAHIILTNPDLLHVTLLPNHEKYRSLFSRLKFVVVDEAHVYRGIFGCHVSAVFRRLLRVCELYETYPQFITFTATIANPKKHFEMVIGDSASKFSVASNMMRPLTVIDSSLDGSPRGARQWALWNPPLKRLPEPEGDAGIIDESPTSDEHLSAPATPSPEAEGRARSSSHSSANDNFDNSLTVSVSTVQSQKQNSEGLESADTHFVQSRLLSSPERAKRRLLARAIRLQRLMDSHPLSRKSSIYETAQLLTTMVLANLRTIVFVRVRKLVELVVKYSRAQLLASPQPEMASRICSYRAGYTRARRRELEAKIFSGEMRGTVSTNALELGIDIGSLDVVIILGFPGSISSLWQQSGRSGRGEREALNIMVAWDSPVDQYFCNSPAELFSRAPEAAVLDPCNPNVLKEHLPCCAAEYPLCSCSAGKLCRGQSCGCSTKNFIDSAHSSQNGDGSMNGSAKTGSSVRLIRNDASRWNMEVFYDTLSDLVSERLLISLCKKQCSTKSARVTEHLKLWAPHPVLEQPARRVNLRSIDEIQIDVVREDTGEKIDSIERFRSYWEVHPGAIYSNAANQFLVINLDLDRKLAIVRPLKKINYYTSVQDHTDVNVLTRLAQWQPRTSEGAQQQLPFSAPIYFGRVEIITKVWGYRKHHVKTQRIFDTVPFSLPPITYASVGFWVDLASELRLRVESSGCDFLGSIHGANHAVLACIPLLVASEKQDTGCECPSVYQIRARPLRLVVFDAHPGGIGVAERVFSQAGELLRTARDLVKQCKCQLQTGCPSCVLDTNCREHNDVMDKRGALIVLESVCNSIGV